MPHLDPAELLGRLVAVDSTSGQSNLPLVDLLCSVLDRPGVRLERLPTRREGEVNLVATVGPEPADGRGLVLSGHMDTVPAGEPGWKSDPFALTDRADRWVGRGTCDMKGFLALAAALAAGLDPARLAAPLVLLFTRDEELGSLGAQELAGGWPADRPLPRATVVGEPTSLRVVRMHKGHLRLRVVFRGRAAHSGTPHRGANAIEPAGRAIAALGELRRRLESEEAESARFFPEAPYVTLNLGHVEGGGALNVVPARCEVGVGLRPLPGMDSAQLVERVRSAVAAAVPDGGWTLEVENDSPPLLLAADAEIHRALAALLAQPGSAGAPFSSDAGALQRLGLECVLFGPGSIEDAHRPNESVSKAEMRRAGEVLERLVARFCGGAAG